jgi:hypothetical protein
MLLMLVQSPKAGIEGVSFLLLSQAPANGGIKGSVVDAATGAPLAGINVLARALVPPSPSVNPGNPPSAVTDEKGVFEFRDLESAEYAVSVEGVVSQQGYARQVYGATRPGAEGWSRVKPVTVVAGKVTDGVTIRLTKGGTISGRILDMNSQPFVDAEVLIHRARYNEEGVRQFIGELVRVNVNDRGEYRLFGIDPGVVYLHAGPQIRLVVTTPGGATNRYAETTYYPRASTFTESTPIEIKPGVELTNMDIQLLPRAPTFSISGRMVDSRTGQPPTRNIQPDLVPRDREVGTLRGYIPEYGPNGTFTVRDVVEGDYWMSAALCAPSGPPSPGQRPSFCPEPLVSFHRITVRGADVSGIVFEFFPSVDVSGRIRFEAADVGIPPGISVQLDLVRNGVFPMNMRQSPKPATVGTDGKFTILQIPQGEYRIKVTGVPKEIYIKDVKVGGSDAFHAPLNVGATAPDPIEISFIRGSGRVQGRLINDEDAPVANAQVVLIPTAARSRADLYRTATSDPAGRFEISGVLDGDYKAFAWETLLPYEYFDPKFLAAAEDRGVSIHVEDGGAITITVRQIRQDIR